MSPAELEPAVPAAAYLRLKATCGVTATGVLARFLATRADKHIHVSGAVLHGTVWRASA